MFTYEQSRKYLIEHLAKDAEHHLSGHFSKVGEAFDEFDANLPRDAGDEFNKFHIALNFWDSWQDARNHNWLYYPKIKQDDWPILAMSIVDDLSEDRNIQNHLVLECFDYSK